MRRGFVFLVIVLAACGTEPGEATFSEKTDTAATAITASVTTAADTFAGLAPDTATAVLPPVPPLKTPSGTYQCVLPDEGAGILHTVAFYPNSFRLQEEYLSRKDSTVVAEGTWAPSAGFIWAYKDQVVRSRYTWKGDTLQYYSPRLKKSFPMNRLTQVTANPVWQTKKAEGVHLYAIGTEPFWSVEVTNEDSLLLNMPDWNKPLRAKLSATNLVKDSTIYASYTDSLQLTVYPLFCSDGMSDFLYTKKVKLQYRGQIYRGCGEVLANPRLR